LRTSSVGATGLTAATSVVAHALLRAAPALLPALGAPVSRRVSTRQARVPAPQFAAAPQFPPQTARGASVPSCQHGALKSRASLALMLLLSVIGTACRQDMHDQPKYIPLRPSTFFNDGRSARPLVEGSVARGQLHEDAALYTGKSADGKLLETFPFPVTPQVLARGQDRFNIYCTPCHGRLGDGSGMVVRRGFRRPPSYHIDRLRAAPAGHFFDVITNGIGAMQDYAAQLDAPDRWAIVAYIRALQLSQNANVSDAPPAARAQLESNTGGAR
jgi:mono/diheme cytochrome c family protein